MLPIRLPFSLYMGMNNYPTNNSIKTWAEEDRPREKLLQKGCQALSNAELLAILLGTGIRGQSAVDLAKEILTGCGNNLLELSRKSVTELTGSFHGIGPAKALTLIAALELGNRKRSTKALERAQITSSRDAYEIMAPILIDRIYEEFWIIMLNRANRVIEAKCISEGGVAGTVADPKKIFKMALAMNASNIVLAHNHPSGCVNPSDADIQLTRKMKDSGILLDLFVVDHIIIGDENYYSFADEGRL